MRRLRVKTLRRFQNIFEFSLFFMGALNFFLLNLFAKATKKE